MLLETRKRNPRGICAVVASGARRGTTHGCNLAKHRFERIDEPVSPSTAPEGGACTTRKWIGHSHIWRGLSRGSTCQHWCRLASCRGRRGS